MSHLKKGIILPIILLLIGLIVSAAIVLIFVKSKLATQTAQTQTPTATLPTPTPADETSNWKTYKNDLLNYQIKYPVGTKVIKPNYSTISDKPSDVIFEFGNCLKSSSECSDSVEVVVIKSRNESLDTYVQGEGKSFSSRCNINKTTMGGEEAFEINKCLVGNSSFFYSNKGNSIFKIALNDTSNKIQNQILSTFKFTN